MRAHLQANPYDFDSNVPLAVRGPGIPAGSVSNALVTNIDLPPTFLELAGVPDQWPDGSGRRDGRSIVPLLNAASAAAAAGSATAGDAVAATSAPAPVPIPAGWRDRLVIEFIGWESWQWLAPCQFNLTPGPCGADQHAGMTNAASNCYTSLRVVNETHNTLYAEYRCACPFAALLTQFACACLSLQLLRWSRGILPAGSNSRRCRTRPPTSQKRTT